MDRPHPDLHKRLMNAEEARKLIEDESIWLPCKKPEHIFYDIDRVIPLDNSKINDEDAICAAIEILNSVIIPEAYRESQFSKVHH